MRIHPPLNNPRMSTWSRLIMIQIPTTMIQMKKGILPQEGLRQRRCRIRNLFQSHRRQH